MDLHDFLINKNVIDIGSDIGLFLYSQCQHILYKSILFKPCTEYLKYSKKLLANYNNITFYNFWFIK